MEYFHTQRDATFSNPTAAIVASVVVVTIYVAAIIETPIKTVAPTIRNQPIFPSAYNRLPTAYPWGMPPNFTSQFANEGVFILHQALAAPSAAGNYAFP